MRIISRIYWLVMNDERLDHVSWFIFFPSFFFWFQVNISSTWFLPQEGFPVFYRYFRDKVTWNEADAICEFHHGDLITGEFFFLFIKKKREDLFFLFLDAKRKMGFFKGTIFCNGFDILSDIEYVLCIQGRREKKENKGWIIIAVAHPQVKHGISRKIEALNFRFSDIFFVGAKNIGRNINVNFVQFVKKLGCKMRIIFR